MPPCRRRNDTPDVPCRQRKNLTNFALEPVGLESNLGRFDTDRSENQNSLLTKCVRCDQDPKTSGSKRRAFRPLTIAQLDRSSHILTTKVHVEISNVANVCTTIRNDLYQKMINDICITSWGREDAALG